MKDLKNPSKEGGGVQNRFEIDKSSSKRPSKMVVYHSSSVSVIDLSSIITEQ